MRQVRSPGREQIYGASLDSIYELPAVSMWSEGTRPRGSGEYGIPGFLIVHHFYCDSSNFSNLLGGITAQRLTPDPFLDSGQQSRSQAVGQERMRLAVSHGRPRNCSSLLAVVFQNGRANGDALITDVGPPVVTGVGARNKFRNGILRLMAKRARGDVGICLAHPSYLQFREYRWSRPSLERWGPRPTYLSAEQASITPVADIWTSKGAHPPRDGGTYEAALFMPPGERYRLLSAAISRRPLADGDAADRLNKRLSNSSDARSHRATFR
jgi:hypothetical protein